MTRFMTIMFAMVVMFTLSASAKIGGGQKNNNYTATATVTTTSTAASTYAPQSAKSNATTSKKSVRVVGKVLRKESCAEGFYVWLSVFSGEGALRQLAELFKTGKIKVMCENPHLYPAKGDIITFDYDYENRIGINYINPNAVARDAHDAVREGGILGAIFGL